MASCALRQRVRLIDPEEEAKITAEWQKARVEEELQRAEARNRQVATRARR